LRSSENAAFKTNSAEMKQGIEGVTMAIKVLKDYYAQDAAHGSAGGSSSGIISLLEVCESDFTKGLTEMTAEEDSSAADYKAYSKEDEVANVMKQQDVKYKNKDAAGLDKAVSEVSGDLSATTDELAAVVSALDKLKDMCVAKAEPYAEKVARRTAEIAGLKEALEILESETALIQKSTKRSLRHVTKAKLDINQKVYIENQPVLGDGAGAGALNVCRAFAPQHVSNPAAPNVRVCGTGIKMTAYLRGECQGYYEHSKVIGKCDTKMPPSTCDSWSPANDARFGHYQSYNIEPC